MSTGAPCSTTTTREDFFFVLGQIAQVQQFPERSNVRLRHLERLELAEFPVVAQTGDVLSQPLEGVVQAVHPLPLPRVRRPTPLVSGMVIWAFRLLRADSGFMFDTIGVL